MSRADLQTFGELLREYRIAAGLTQEALAERARLSRAAVAKLERGTRQRPYPATIALLADALSLSPSDRFNLEQAAQRGTTSAVRATHVWSRTSTLPLHFSSFVGRDRDVAKGRDLVETRRLVTLVGAGGVGKTRLAVHTAEQFIVADAPVQPHDGVWFVDLSVVTDPQAIVPAVGSAVGMEQCRTLDMLVRYLRAQRFLLIIDNCEHLLDDVAHLAGELLRHCPNAQILATSRQRLCLDGERVYRVPTLNVPAADAVADLSVSEALQFSAIRLFADRAEAADSNFELRQSMVPAAAEICRRLDGIALAIELAAARTNAFSPATLAEQLDEHFLSFTGALHGSLSRHKTMRAAFDWSYGLLDELERQVFRRLSIFVGGFTLELATSLLRGTIEERGLVEILASLVDKSLVQCDRSFEPARYRMLAPAWQYAQVQLRRQHEQNAAALAHATAMLELAEHFDSILEFIPNRIWDAYIEPERGNFHAAFDWSLRPDGDTILAQRLTGSRTATRGGFASGEVRNWTAAALKTCNRDTPLHVQSKLALTAARSAINFEANLETTLALSRRALELQQPGDLRSVGDAQYLVGAALHRMARLDEADRMFRRAIATARACGAQREYFTATWGLASLRYTAGDLDEARTLIAEALGHSGAAGADRERINATTSSAEIEFAGGCIEKAVSLVEEAIEFFRARANPVRLSRSLCNLSAYLIALDRYEEARDRAHEALQCSSIAGITSDVPWVIQHLAAIALLSNDCGKDLTRFLRAANLLGFINDVTSRSGRWRGYTEQQEYDKMISALREVFDEDQLTRLMDVGKDWSEEQAVAESLAIERD